MNIKSKYDKTSKLNFPFFIIYNQHFINSENFPDAEEDARMMYMYLMNNLKPVNKELIKSHVEYLKELKRLGKLTLCGPFTDYPGGIVIFTAKDLNEATSIAKNDPFISSGCKSYEIRTIEPANEENNYLLDE